VLFVKFILTSAALIGLLRQLENERSELNHDYKAHRNSSSTDVWMWRVSVNGSTERYRLLSSSKHLFILLHLNSKLYSKLHSVGQCFSELL